MTQLLRVREAAERLGVDRSKAYDLIRQGILPAKRIPGIADLRVPLDELARLIDESRWAVAKED